MPLQRFAGGRFSSGYWSVVGLEKKYPKVTFKPFNNGMIIFDLSL
jgi:hypothetical protein